MEGAAVVDDAVDAEIVEDDGLAVVDGSRVIGAEDDVSPQATISAHVATIMVARRKLEGIITPRSNHDKREHAARNGP